MKTMNKPMNGRLSGIEINPISNKRVDKWELPVRKMAHYLLFASGGFILCLLLNLSIAKKHKNLIAIFLGLLLAFIDEFHQLYSSNRTARISDVGIDTLGVISGILVANVLLKILHKIETRRQIKKRQLTEERKENYDKL